VKNLKFKTKRYLPLVVAVVMALVFAFSSSANALQLWIESLGPVTGSAVVNDTDGDGVVTFMGMIGNFQTVVSTGVSKPAIGSTTRPVMDLNTVEVTSVGAFAGTLRIRVTDTDFGPVGSGSNVEFVSMIHGNYAPPIATGNIKFDVYYDADNDPYGISSTPSTAPVKVASLGPYLSAGFGDTDVKTVTNPGAPFSLTLDLYVHHDKGGMTTSMDTNTSTTPEPGTILLLGMGLLGLGVIGRKKISVKDKEEA
jgi:hypothetical protein